MCTIGLISKSNPNTVTEIPNRFIDEFMVEANGTYVKVYLYLLRHLEEGMDFSVSEIAELLDCTENFLFKALNYWTRQGILEYTMSGNGTVESINLVDLADYRPKTRRAGASVSVVSKKSAAQSVSKRLNEESEETEDIAVPARKPAKTAVQKIDIDAMAEDENVPFILSTLEQYFARPLSREESDTALYIYGGLGFSCDLLLFLYEKCIDAGKTSSKYINKVALSWNDAGIASLEDAENYLLLNGEAFGAVRDEFGLSGSLGASQIRFLRTWVRDWHMPTELIREACSRAMLRKGASFNYANSILKSWHESGASSTEDVERLDAAHKLEEDNKHKTPAAKAAAQKPNRFDNFTQREYSAATMAEIEKRMRGKK